jgi:nucleotide-binding universal stress UspA family protein
MQRFKNILFLADGSEGQETVLERAAKLAHSNKAKLTLFDTVETSEFVPPEEFLAETVKGLREALIRDRREDLDVLSKELVKRYPSLNVAVMIEKGNKARGAIRAVLSGEHDLVMKAPQRGSAKLGMLFGGTDQKLMRKCPCPVWIVKPDKPSFQKILAAVEVNPNEPEAGSIAKRIMELSTSLAASEGSELHVLHAWDLVGEVKLRSGHINIADVEKLVAQMEAAHQKGLDQLVKEHPYDRTHVHLVRGDAGDVIVDFAEAQQIDLVVIGTVGRTGIPGLLIGNTAEEVLSSVQCSVLTLKPEGFKSPIEA